MHPKTLMAAIALAIPAFALVPRLHAQDVTVTPLEWVDADDPPDRLPVENHALKPRVPQDLQNVPDPGYVILEFYTDEKGKRRTLGATGTLPAYEDSARTAAVGWKHEPGRRLDKPVNTVARCVVIFNPASSEPGKPDATPRLLYVKHEVVDPSRKKPDNQPVWPPEVVWATVSLDATGAPVRVKDAPPALAGLIERAVQDWKFAPARHGGQPVAGELRVPIIIVGPASHWQGKQVPPRVLAQAAPVYPMAMRRSGLKGDVLVDFVVDREGRVTHAYVVRSMNPAFDEPALEAVRRWRFEPGTWGGTPVNTHMRVPIRFQLEGAWDGGDTGLTVEHKGRKEDLPAELRYDVAPKPLGRVSVVYPYALLRDKVKGKAKVSFLISEAGKVIYANVDQATQPEFGAAAIAMIEEWEFEPALKAGRPTQSGFAYEQEFSRYDEELVTAQVSDALELEQKHPERIVNAGSLDERLKPTSTRPPVFPMMARGKFDRGEATVEILIDEEGYVRLPRVISATDPAFGWAAVQAAAVWRFEPPKRKGHAVTTRVRIPFEFTLGSTPPAEGKK